MAAVWISGPSAPMATVSWLRFSRSRMWNMYSAPCGAQTLPGTMVMPCTVDLRGTAQQHGQCRAIVAEEAGIGVEHNEYPCRRPIRPASTRNPVRNRIMNSHYSAMRRSPLAHATIAMHEAVMKKVRWGVLGVAKIAVTRVIPAMQAGECSEVVGIASRDRAQRRSGGAANSAFPKPTAPTRRCWRTRRSTRSTIRCPITCTCRGPRAPPRQASTCSARSRSASTCRKRSN